jgi:glycosyltransferase involved in cell wall biosynthesis
MKNKKISVVVPCFNEGRTIYQNIKKIHNFISENFLACEIIAVNDGSCDNTSLELKRVQKEIPLTIIDNCINEGKGKAVRDGILASRHEIVMFLDADLAIPIEEIEKFVVEIDKGNNIVIASRFVPGYKSLMPVLWYRRVMEKVFQFLRMLIINNFKIKDTQCGFKVFHRQAAMKIFSHMTINRFAFDSEIIFIASARGFKIKELPIVLQNPIRSSIRICYDSANMFLDLIKIRANYFLGKYVVLENIDKK